MPRVKGSLPEIVRKKIERDVGGYCEQRIPPHVRDEIRMEYEIRANAVTIVERRPPWNPGLRAEWSRSVVAQFRYEDGLWTLYWADRNSRWHVYDDLEPTSDVATVLAEIDDDPTGIFWG